MGLYELKSIPIIRKPGRGDRLEVIIMCLTIDILPSTATYAVVQNIGKIYFKS